MTLKFTRDGDGIYTAGEYTVRRDPFADARRAWSARWTGDFSEALLGHFASKSAAVAACVSHAA